MVGVKGSVDVEPRKKKILPVIVGDQRVLMTVFVEAIEQRVGFFLGLIKPDQVELITIAVTCSKQPYAAVDIGKDEAAEIADKELTTDPQRSEVVVRAEVRQLGFEEPFFHREVLTES